MERKIHLTEEPPHKIRGNHPKLVCGERPTSSNWVAWGNREQVNCPDCRAAAGLPALPKAPETIYRY